MMGLIQVPAPHLMFETTGAEQKLISVELFEADATIYTVPTGFTLWVYDVAYFYQNANAAYQSCTIIFQDDATNNLAVFVLGNVGVNLTVYQQSFTMPISMLSDYVIKSGVVGSGEYVFGFIAGVLLKDQI